MTEAPKTVFVTRNALKDGIVESEVRAEHGSGCLSVKGDWHVLTRSDWHTTREAAVTRAEQMKAARLKSLRKQIEKVEGLRF